MFPSRCQEHGQDVPVVGGQRAELACLEPPRQLGAAGPGTPSGSTTIARRRPGSPGAGGDGLTQCRSSGRAGVGHPIVAGNVDAAHRRLHLDGCRSGADRGLPDATERRVGGRNAMEPDSAQFGPGTDDCARPRSQVKADRTRFTSNPRLMGLDPATDAHRAGSGFDLERPVDILQPGGAGGDHHRQRAGDALDAQRARSPRRRRRPPDAPGPPAARSPATSGANGDASSRGLRS